MAALDALLHHHPQRLHAPWRYNRVCGDVDGKETSEGSCVSEWGIYTNAPCTAACHVISRQINRGMERTLAGALGGGEIVDVQRLQLRQMPCTVLVCWLGAEMKEDEREERMSKY